MTGLEQVGIPGSEHLREALTNCTDPREAIETFQVENGILLPSLRPALPFLDLHGVQRLDFHTSVLDEIRERLLQRVKILAATKDKNNLKILNDLLVKSFPVIKVKAIRAVVLCIMQHLPRIKQEYLTAVMNDPDLYRDVAIEVKQQIWQDHQALFGDEVSPLLSKYIEDKDAALLNHENLQQTFFAPSPKARRQMEVVQKLTQMIGTNVKLYDMVLQFLRTLFLRTRNVHYCTLRAELLMALHDNEVHEICSVDPCHKFTWCLDACIRERFVDSKRARELQGFLDGIRRGQEQVLGDLSMILCDPYAIHTVALSIMKSLQQTASMEAMPRHSEELILLLRMLSLGLGAWTMIDSQVFKEPKLETPLVTKFLPSLLSVMVDDMMHVKKSEEVEPLPESILPYCRDTGVACHVLAYYMFHVTRQRDILAVTRIVPTLAQAIHAYVCDPDTVYHDMTLHVLVSYLSSMADAFSSLDFCMTVIDGLFLPMVSRENILRHLLRLLWWIHGKMPPIKLTAVIEALKPTNQHSPIIHTIYTGLVEKVSTHQPSPVSEPKNLDSPLMSVPAPTPRHA